MISHVASVSFARSEQKLKSLVLFEDSREVYVESSRAGMRHQISHSHVLAQTAYYLGLEHMELRTRVIDPVSQA